MNPQILKMAVGLIGPENIKNALKQLLNSGIALKNEVELQPGETDAILIAFEVNGQTFASLFTVDSQPEPIVLKREIKTWSVDQIAENLVKNI